MADNEAVPQGERGESVPPATPISDAEAEATALEAFDLDGDGKVSIVEDARARLGILDARLEEIAEGGGVTGKLAEVAHDVVDRLDND